MSSLPGPGAEPDFETWLRQFAHRLLWWAYYYTRDMKLAEDIAQDAAVKAFKAWPEEEARDKLAYPGYVHTIVFHCFLDHVKVRPRTNYGEVEFVVERHDRPGREVDHDLRRAVLSLQCDERNMIILRYYEDLPIKEAGRLLGLSMSKAYRLHDRALAHLAGELDEGKA
jgi:RNA polymerase sigma-70 factor, ECF subfamily